MPASIREHVRYPEDIFAIQAQVYATYHMTQPAVYYNREDQWEIPTVDDGNDRNAMQPYYTIMRLPGEKEAEFIQMLPFTPRRRDNLAAWLVARSDGEHYGRLGVFEFPKQKLVFGPRQVVARIAQDQVISPQITLWNQQGSQVIWGHADGDSHRGVADLRETALPARAGRTHSGADTSDRRLREPNRDGGDARRRSRSTLLYRSGSGETGAAARHSRARRTDNAAAGTDLVRR
jgi:hypothetical protein